MQAGKNMEIMKSYVKTYKNWGKGFLLTTL